jgi:hypothetical protein
MKKITLIVVFVLCFILGILYVSLVDKGEKEEQKITGEQEKEIFEFDTLQTINDSITIRQIRQMDSLHAAGKL